MKQPSLFLRLSTLLLCGQAIIILLVSTVPYIPLLVENWRAHTYGLTNAQKLVIASLVQEREGLTHIEPTSELRAYVERTPTFRFAVFDSGTGLALSGSSSNLVAAIGDQRGAAVDHEAFTLRQGSDKDMNGYSHMFDTPVGKYSIAVYGYGRGDEDIWAAVLSDLFFISGDNFRKLFPIFVVSIGMGWLALHRGLSPLTHAVDQVRSVDVTSVAQRISCASIPVEIVPLITTINGALARLDAGISQQNRFLANAAHEMRTPIMILYARLNGPEKPTFRTDIERDVRRVHNIVEQLLAFGRLSRSEVLLHQQIDLAEAVPSMVDDHALLAVESGRRLEFEGAEEPVLVRGDRRSINSVVANLIDNALRVEPEGGIVLVRLNADATIEVVDHGEGVTASDREMIFEPFWRKTEAMPGSGLGLAIAKELIEKHGGRIWVEETLGGGATFKVSFPKENSN